MTLFSYLRYLDFYTSNWDLGIEMQMLSTSFHHSILFETADLQSYGTVSQLEIHSTYIAVPFALIYQHFQTPLFLFATQSLVVSLSIVPIAMISRRLGLRWRSIVFVVLLYLFSFPIIASQFYDFHFEAFIPLEFFFLFYLVMEKRVWSSTGVIAIGSMTLEVFPFLSLAVLLYFFFDRGIPKLRQYSSLFTRKYSDLYFLGVFSLLIFVVIKALQFYVLPAALNNVAGMHYLLGLKRESLISTSFAPVASLSGVVYWLILYASVGFLPFFHRRHLILNIPWMYETIFLKPEYAFLGDQYNFIAMLGLVVGMIYAFRTSTKADAEERHITLPAAIGASGIAIFALNSFQFASVRLSMLPYMAASIVLIVVVAWIIGNGKYPQIARSLRGWTSARKVVVIAFLLLLTMNIVFSPLSSSSGIHESDNGYSFSYSINPEYHAAKTLAGMIPANASVIASDNLFPFVSSDVNAYSFFYKPLQNLSYVAYFNFSSEFSFTYVFVDQAQLKYVPTEDAAYLNNSYGLLAEVETNLSYPGNIYLLSLHYNGMPSIIHA